MILSVLPLLLACSSQPSAEPHSASNATAERSGRVTFYVKAKPSFDEWTRAPTPAVARWMRDHYARMLSYSPYFDSRLAWFPNAWVYINAYAIKPASGLQTQHPQWLLRDERGRALYIPYACQNGTCPQLAADLGNPDYRQHWLARARDLLRRGYLGLRIDDVNMTWRVSDGTGAFVNPIDVRTQRPMTLQQYRRNTVEFLELVRSSFPNIEIVHNMIWYAAEIDDPLLHRQLRAADYLGLQRGVSDRGIRGRDGQYGFDRFLAFVDQVHQLDRGIVFDDDDRDNQSTANRDYELAFYLLVNQGKDLLGADGDRSRMNPASFYPGYRVDLGEPKGSRLWLTDALLGREFKHGLVLVNPPGGKRACLTLPRPGWDLDGNRHEQRCLPSPGGAVTLWQRTQL